MSLLSILFRRRRVEEPFDPNPMEISEMPVRPYRVLQAGLAFFSDPECRSRVPDATLMLLRADDPSQKQHPVECMPALKNYRVGDIVRWEINQKRQWAAAWYVDPHTGGRQKAWVRAVEFIGAVVKSR